MDNAKQQYFKNLEGIKYCENKMEVLNDYFMVFSTSYSNSICS